MTEHISSADLLLAFDGELSPERDEVVRAHRRECPSCEAQWMRLADLSREVAAVQCPEVRFRSEEAAVASLLASLDHVRPRRAVSARLWANTLAAAAIAAIAVISLPTLRSRVQAPSRPAASYDYDDPVPAGYTSLPYADPALPLDDATVLPVELSTEDLELMGLDAGLAAGGRDEVKAEVLLGIDGWPRAIKILDPQ